MRNCVAYYVGDELRGKVEKRMMAVAEGEGTLSDGQRLVLQAIYDRFREHGRWPTFISIDRPLRREHRMDTRAVLNSLPESLVYKSRLAMGPSDTDELKLRLPGIAVCAGGREDCERFVRLLPWFAEQEVAFTPPTDSEDTMPRITSDDVAAYLGLRRSDPEYDGALARLYAMLCLERPGLGRNGSNDEGWDLYLTPDIWRFRDVQTIDDVIDARDQRTAEAQAAAPHFHVEPQVTWSGSIIGQPETPDNAPPPLPQRDSYVDEQVIAALMAKSDASRFDTGKLLALIKELNANHAAEYTYASHALLRAILDHIPPILDCADFKAVVNNYSWGRTDRDYIQQLLRCKSQADDALHRPISGKPCVLRFSDLPASVCVNRLLQECADHL